MASLCVLPAAPPKRRPASSSTRAAYSLNRAPIDIGDPTDLREDRRQRDSLLRKAVSDLLLVRRIARSGQNRSLDQQLETIRKDVGRDALVRLQQLSEMAPPPKIMSRRINSVQRSPKISSDRLIGQYGRCLFVPCELRRARIIAASLHGLQLLGCCKQMSGDPTPRSLLTQRREVGMTSMAKAVPRATGRQSNILSQRANPHQSCAAGPIPVER